MANYRRIHQKIWHDPDFEEYIAPQKLVFLHSCTNSLTTESGIYPISPNTIAHETRIPLDKVLEILKTTKNLLYDYENKVIFVANFRKYNGNGNTVNVLKSILNDMNFIRTPLWNEFKKRYPDTIKRLELLKQQLTKGSIPIPTPIPDPVQIPNPAPNHNPNHTHNDVPVKKMLEIFEEYWQLWNEGSYLHDYEAEEHVAEIIYRQCLKDRPEDPLGIFKHKVEDLVQAYDVKQFVGLHKFWNAAATRAIPESTEEENNETNNY